MYLQTNNAVETNDSNLPEEWDATRLRDELRKRKVWTANIPGNVEGWYAKLLTPVTEGRFTFEEFVDEYARSERFDFGKTLEVLLNPTPAIAGGWYNSALND